MVYALAMLIGGLAIAFWKGPVFTCITLAYMPLMVGVFAVFGKQVANKMKLKLEATK